MISKKKNERGICYGRKDTEREKEWNACII